AHDGGGKRVHVRAGVRDDEVLAARLAHETRVIGVLAEMPRHLPPQPLEHLRRAGEVDAAEVPVGEHAGAHVRGRPGHEVHHADHSRHASRAAAIASSISFGPAWCTLASTWRWQCGITASTVLPVRTSRPPTTTGISRTRADRSFRVRFSSTRSGEPGAYERT